MNFLHGNFAAALAFVLAAWTAQSSHAQFRPMAAGPADAPPTLVPAEPADFGPHPMGDPPRDIEALPAKDRIRLKLEDGSTILGEVPPEATVTLKSRLGELKIPLEDIARIDGSEFENKFRVTFSNGDRLLGEVKFADAALKTAWGEVPLSPKGLVALEAGKLRNRQIAQTRISPDGRTVVTRTRNVADFQPQVGHPDEPASPYGPATPISTYESVPYPVPLVPASSFSAPAPYVPSGKPFPAP